MGRTVIQQPGKPKLARQHGGVNASAADCARSQYLLRAQPRKISAEALACASLRLRLACQDELAQAQKSHPTNRRRFGIFRSA
jgi:hypothetical protein